MPPADGPRVSIAHGCGRWSQPSRMGAPLVSRLSIAAVVAFTLILGGCVGPALADHHYVGTAASSLDRASGRLEAVRVTADAATDGRVTGHLVATIVGEAEEAIGYARTAFLTRQPPPGHDQLRTETLELLSDAEELVATVRVAAFRGDLDAVNSHAEDLGTLADELHRRADELHRRAREMTQ